LLHGLGRRRSQRPFRFKRRPGTVRFEIGQRVALRGFLLIRDATQLAMGGRTCLVLTLPPGLVDVSRWGKQTAIGAGPKTHDVSHE